MKILKNMVAVMKATGEEVSIEKVENGIVHLSNGCKVKRSLAEEIFRETRVPENFEFKAEINEFGNMVVNGDRVETGSIKPEEIFAQSGEYVYLKAKGAGGTIDVYQYSMRMDHFTPLHKGVKDAVSVLSEGGLMIYQVTVEKRVEVYSEDGETKKAIFIPDVTTIFSYKGNPFFVTRSIEDCHTFGDIVDRRVRDTEEGKKITFLSISYDEPEPLNTDDSNTVVFKKDELPFSFSAGEFTISIKDGEEKIDFKSCFHKDLRSDVVGKINDWDYYPGIEAYALRGENGITIATLDGRVRNFLIEDNKSWITDSELLNFAFSRGRGENSVTLGKYEEDGSLSVIKVKVSSNTDRGYVTEVISL